MSLRKQIIIFCGSSGSSNYDNRDHTTPTKSQIQCYMLLNAKPTHSQYIKIQNIFRIHKSTIIQKSTSIITDMKVAASIFGTDSIKIISTVDSNNMVKQTKNDQFYALELSSLGGSRIENLSTVMSELVQYQGFNQKSGLLQGEFDIQTISDVLSVQDIQ